MPVLTYYVSLNNDVHLRDIEREIVARASEPANAGYFIIIYYTLP